MRHDATDISIVLDRSGSMRVVADDTIGGFNRFLEDQRKVPGTARLTLAQFDNLYEVVHGGVPLDEVPPLTSETFVPRGSTALLDAIGRTINETGRRLSDTPEADRPAQVVFVIVTDGLENASVEFTRPQVFDMITHQRERYNWQFVFLGANQDAIKSGAGLGIAPRSSMTYSSNAKGSRAAFKSLSGSIRSYRSGESASPEFSDEDRKRQEEALEAWRKGREGGPQN